MINGKRDRWDAYCQSRLVLQVSSCTLPVIIIVFSVPFHELVVGRLRLNPSNSAGLKHHHDAVPVDYNPLRWSLPNSSSVAPVGACLRLPMYSKLSLPSLRPSFSPHVRASAVCSSSYCQRCPVRTKNDIWLRNDPWLRNSKEAFYGFRLETFPGFLSTVHSEPE